jgi:hypothetical protein
MEKIELACDMSYVDEFADWLKSELPNVEVVIGDTTWSFIDGVRANYCGDSRLNDLWEAFCGHGGSLMPEPEDSAPRASIEHKWDGEFWEASCDHAYTKGYGHTPEQATLVLFRRLEGRKLWRFDKCEPDFEALMTSKTVVRKFVECGVYTTSQLRLMSPLEAKLLDIMMNAKGRVFKGWYICN